MSAAAAASELALDLPVHPSSVTSARHAVQDWAGAFGAHTGDIALAVSEAVGNAVVHAFKGRSAGTIRLRGQHEADRLIVEVSDDGIGMTPNLDSPGLGMGISLISKLAHDVRVDSSERGTTISMSFDTKRSAAEGGQ
jgi:anti-sigma regulatory factor (Ser/Thr protein kinase)